MQKSLLSYLFLSGIFVFLFQQRVTAQHDSVAYTLFLIGDCGEPSVREAPIGNVLRREVNKSGKDAMVLYLGDNVYPFGLHPIGHPGRDRGESILKAQSSWVSGLGVRGIFIPGNHDWQHWNRKGWEYVGNQQAFLDSLNDEFIMLQPRDGCPGPVEIPLTDQSVLVIIDTQWILHSHDKPGEDSECDARDPNTLMFMLEDVLNRNRGKRVIIAGHHPVISYGDHGGVFTFQDHMFPLVDLWPKAYVPMPVIGSIYPLYRSMFGSSQDIKHPNYKQFSIMLQDMLAKHPGALYVAGHEHALQHIQKDSVHYIVSGSGSKTGYVKRGRHAVYASGIKGFVKFEMLSNGRGKLQYWNVDEDFPEGRIVHEAEMVSVRALQEPEETSDGLKTGIVRARASNQYRAGKVHSFLLGKNYRDAWEQEIEVPIFNISQELGGLKVIQKGGGQQTLSLRLADANGREYVLRSVEKFPENAVPEMFRKTFAQDLVQDQISASHPYGALVVPFLAGAAGIYHTNPKVVFVGDDPALGVYRKEFANRLALFEERPADDWSDSKSFGNSKKIVNTSKVLQKLSKDSETEIDQKFVLRSRIFDLWIGDWDRHDDQWRWAEIAKGNKEYYRPVPRDRDQAFFVNEGVLAKVWSRKWALPKFEGFDSEINWAPGLAFNARYFDRTFLSKMDEGDWKKQARELQALLTDEVIDNAIRQWPKEIYELNGRKVAEHLKERRATLVDDALSLYKFLSRQVDVVGSDKNEVFKIKREKDGDVEVKMYKVNKKGEHEKVYDRKFKHDETDEIHIYGSGGEDQFLLEGETAKSIRVRIIGGDGKDSINDASKVNGLQRKTIFYDTKSENAIESKGELRDETSNSPYVNQYNRKGFKYNRLAPLVYGNFNHDDGIFIGGGFLYQTEGFRKDPFKQRHIFLASVAPRTNSYNFLYRGDFTDIIGKWGLSLDVDVKAPNYVNNFFGMGNETIFNKDLEDDPNYDVDEEIDFYRFRFEEEKLEAYLTRRFGNSTLRIGPALQRVKVERSSGGDRYIEEEFAPTLPYDIFRESNTYAGLAGSITIDNRNNARLTTRGSFLSVESRGMRGLDENANDFVTLDGAFALYHTFNNPRWLTFAVRAGAGKTFGDYDFYQAQILGGRTELRGYRKTRFYGDSKAYANFEVRARLASFKTYLFPASFGVLAFHDTGRVWYKDGAGIDSSANGSSDKWHKGFGGGVWFTPFNLSVLSLEVGHSEESTLAYVRLGFLF